MKKSLILMTALSLFSLHTAFADITNESGLFVGLGGGIINKGSSISPVAKLNFGYQFNRYFAVEANAYTPAPIMFNILTVNAKLILPVSSRVNFYVEGGPALEDAFFGYLDRWTATGGAGVSFATTQHTSISLGYNNVGGVNFATGGFSYRF